MADTESKPAVSDPLELIEQQLRFLESRGQKNLLTGDEVVQLSTLLKTREALLASGRGKIEDESLRELTTEDLKRLLEALK